MLKKSYPNHNVLLKNTVYHPFKRPSTKAIPQRLSESKPSKSPTTAAKNNKTEVLNFFSFEVVRFICLGVGVDAEGGLEWLREAELVVVVPSD